MVEEKKIQTEKKAVQKKKNLSALVYDTKGEQIESIDLPESIFNVKISDELLAQYVRVHQTNQRLGNASTKTRGQVIGSTRKIYRQKGTGRARHGANKAPIFVGGGVAHGPSGKVFALTMNKKQKRQAFFGALTQKYKKDGIRFVKGLLTVTAKTKEMSSILKNQDSQKIKPILITFPKNNSRNMVLASRNIENVTLKDVQSLNAYDILRAKKIIFATEALPVLITHYER